LDAVVGELQLHGQHTAVTDPFLRRFIGQPDGLDVRVQSSPRRAHRLADPQGYERAAASQYGEAGRDRQRPEGCPPKEGFTSSSRNAGQ